jgi:uncharacterized protein
MRRSSDLSVDRPRRRVSGRGILIVLGGLVLLVMIFGRAIARFYVDYLWHDALGRNDVFWGAIGAKATLFFGCFAIFSVLAAVNLYAADRTAPAIFPANVHPYVERFHDVFGRRLRLVRYGLAGLFALMLATPAIARWQEWMLFRNSQSFGLPDRQFQRDVGFYVFQLPFLTFLLDWMFAAVVVVLLLTTAAHILNGGVVFVSPVPAVRAATKTHIAVLLALLAILKAGAYWLDRFELTNAQTGIVQGATYSVVQARLPALMLLILVAILTAALYFSVARTGSFRAPVIASALWLVVSIFGGLIYPAIVQGFVVNPDQESKEAEYVERNVTATQQAYGLTQVEVRPISFGPLNAGDVQSDLEALDNVRLLNPTQMLNRFTLDRGAEAGLTIADLDVDRFALDPTDPDSPEQVLVAALELDLAGLANKTWQSLRLINTHGCGLVTAPAGRVAGSRPAYTVPDLEQPELYFSPEISSYAITNTASDEKSCDELDPSAGSDTAADAAPVDYSGTQGVRMNSFARRASFALAFLDRNVLLSGAIDNDSQMLWVRDVEDRLKKLAPFLQYDADPYPVEQDGRVKWVVDAYTTTSRYPYSESIGDIQLSVGSGLSPSDNYVRNSVKAVVDAYTGEVTMYVVDDTDPIIAAWQQAFPNLFTDFSEMPEDLRSHLRYPEDLFRVQTDRYSKYRISPAKFFRREGAWSVAQAPPVRPGEVADSTDAALATETAASTTFASESNVERFSPYYTYFDTSADGEPVREEFVIFRPFVEFSTDDARTQLQAFIIASSDPESYGKLTTYVVQPQPGESLPDGPVVVARSADSTPAISEQITLDNQQDGGTSVRFGDLQAVPIAGGLIYVRPYYVTVPTGSTEASDFRKVIVTYNQRSVIDDSIGLALAQLFPGFSADIGDRLPGTTPEDVIEPTADAEAVVARIVELLAEAEELRLDGDLGGYQAKVDQATEIARNSAVQLGLEDLPGAEPDQPVDSTVDTTEPDDG